jgi:hypothetical protein
MPLNTCVHLKNVFQLESTTANYIMPSLGLDRGWFIFSSISTFISSVTPNDMPLIYCILALFRDVFQSKASIIHIILEVKLEKYFNLNRSLKITFQGTQNGIRIYLHNSTHLHHFRNTLRIHHRLVLLQKCSHQVSPRQRHEQE